VRFRTCDLRRQYVTTGILVKRPRPRMGSCPVHACTYVRRRFAVFAFVTLWACDYSVEFPFWNVVNSRGVRDRRDAWITRFPGNRKRRFNPRRDGAEENTGENRKLACNSFGTLSIRVSVVGTFDLTTGVRRKVRKTIAVRKIARTIVLRNGRTVNAILSP